jgi:4-amino-4-deoxy-L-arabinose transferase-like glycosyltransferase
VRLIHILILAFVLDAIVAKSMSQTMDEADHIAYGMKVLRAAPDRSQPYMDSKTPATALNALPRLISEHVGSVPMLRKWLSGLVRLPSILSILVVRSFIYLFAREWYGSTAAIAAATLAALSPNLIAHGTLATTDGYFAAGVLGSMFFLRRYLLEPTLRNALASGLTLALAQLTKPMAIYLYCIAGIFLIASMLRSPGFARLRGKQVAVYAAIAFGLAVAVLNGAYSFDRSLTPLGSYSFQSVPFARIQRAAWIEKLPVPFPYPVLQGLDQVVQVERAGAAYGNVYLLGELRDMAEPGFRGFKSYYLVAWFFKEPIPLQILFIWGIAYIVRRRRAELLFNEGVLLAAAGALVLWFSLFSKAQIGIRHILPALAVETVIASAPFAEFGRSSRRKRVVLVCLVAWLALSTFSYFPHLIPYMNEWVWDRTSSYRILADSNLDWGQDAGVVRRFLKANPDVALDPEEPRSGRILVGANRLVGVAPKDKGPLKWLLPYRPVAQIGYAHFLFVIPSESH